MLQSVMWMWGVFCLVSIFHNQKMHFYFINFLACVVIKGTYLQSNFDIT